MFVWTFFTADFYIQCVSKKPVGLPLQVISRNLVNSQNLLIIFSTDRLYSILN